MKNLFFIATLMLTFSTALYSQNKDDKDWTFDPKTSTLIPKYVGKIKVLSGKALIGERELKKGSKVYNNDLIQTQESSYLVMEMIDLTTVTLGPQSEFKISNWSYRTKTDRDVDFNILKGQWRALIRSKSKDDDQLKIKTPLVSMGVRGTELMVNVFKEKESEFTQVALLEGSVHIESIDGKKQDLKPGDHVVIEKAEKWLQSNDKKMSAEEMKSYQEYSSPGILRLLPPEKIVAAAKTVTQAENKTVDQKTSVSDMTPPSKKKEKTVKENLEILNTVREENRKKK